MSPVRSQSHRGSANVRSYQTSNGMRRVYLDYAASTPVDPEVAKAMELYWKEKYGNPSSLHSFGREAEIAIDEARESLARFFGVDFGEVYFTSGATEANNWMVYMAAHTNHGIPNKKPHIIISAFEHESLLELVTYLESKGAIEATYISPQKNGVIEPSAVEAALKENTVLVSIIYVNNEVGSVQPIKEIGNIIEKHKKNIPGLKQRIPVFHSDAVQAIQFGEPRLEYLKLDAMTVSSHKLCGPKGVGALIVKQSVWMKPLLYGGGQEFSFRSGTSNVPGIIGFAKAIALLGDESRHNAEGARLSALKKDLKDGILKIIPSAYSPIADKDATPHILHMVFPGKESQVMLIALDQEGVAVSAGAACSAKALRPSYVLLAMGYDEAHANASLRFSIGRFTTPADIKVTLRALKKIMAGGNHY